jgi:NADH-quinone oxidoreductase subunit E
VSVRRLDPVQPEGFAFTPENLAWARETIAKYPPGKQASAVIPVLWRAQEQNAGWVSRAAMEYVGKLLDMAYIRVYEVATFYTMFQLSPVGTKAHVQVCGTTPCMLRGAGELIDVCRRRIAPEPHQLSADGAFSWEEVECLGACVNAPMVQVWKDTYEDLTPQTFEKVLDAFARGETPTPGPQNGRQFSAPEGGATTLTARPAKSKPKPVAPAPAEAALPVKREETLPVVKEAAPLPVVKEAPPLPVVKEAPPLPVVKETAPLPLMRETPPPANKPAPSRKPVPVKPAKPAPAKAAPAKAAPVKTAAAKVEAAPELLKKPRGGKGDDLKLIWGVGPALEKMLNGMGVWHFAQIAAWTAAELKWVDDRLEGFKGRAKRDEWIKQAKKLAKGWRPDNSVGEKVK